MCAYTTTWWKIQRSGENASGQNGSCWYCSYSELLELITKSDLFSKFRNSFKLNQAIQFLASDSCLFPEIFQQWTKELIVWYHAWIQGKWMVHKAAWWSSPACSGKIKTNTTYLFKSKWCMRYTGGSVEVHLSSVFDNQSGQHFNREQHATQCIWVYTNEWLKHSVNNTWWWIKIAWTWWCTRGQQLKGATTRQYRIAQQLREQKQTQMVQPKSRMVHISNEETNSTVNEFQHSRLSSIGQIDFGKKTCDIRNSGASQ